MYQKIRAITVRGGTVIALGHTNKHKDSDGQLIYEGTGDLKSDFDIMMFMYPLNNLSDSSFPPSSTKKERKLSPILSIGPDRDVSVEGEYINTREIENQRLREEADKEVVDFIRDLIAKPVNQSQVISACRESGVGRRSQ